MGFFARRRPMLEPVVLTYHGVVNDNCALEPLYDDVFVTASQFQTHLSLLQKHYNIIHPDDYRNWLEHGSPLPTRAVLITCDDGFENNARVMLPLLESAGVACMFFVTTEAAEQVPKPLWLDELHVLLADILGHSAWWQLVQLLSRLGAEDRRIILDLLHETVPPEGLRDVATQAIPQHRHLLNATALQTLVTHGMTIGSHGVSHAVLARQDGTIAKHEITESRNVLRSATNTDIWAFAYPFGTSETVRPCDIEAVRNAGYTAAFLNETSPKPTDPLLLSREHIGLGVWPATLDAIVSGFHGSLRRRTPVTP